MKPPLPLRYSIPVVLVLAGLAQAALVTGYDQRRDRAEIELATSQRAVLLGAPFATRLASSMLRGERDVAERDFQSLRLAPFLRRARLLDDSTRDMAAPVVPFEGPAVAEAQDALFSRLTADARGSRAPRVETSADGRTLGAAFPLQIGLLPGELQPSRMGTLYLEFDLDQQNRTRLMDSVRRAGIIVGLSSVFVLLSWLYFERTITRRVNQLVRTARELAGGNLAARSALRGGDELAALGATLNHMAGEVAGRTEAIRTEEQALRLFRTQIEHISDAIYVIDPTTLGFLDMNDRACQSLGYSRAELLRMGVFDIDPSANAADDRALRTDLQVGGVTRFETQHRRKDGTTFPIEAVSRLVHVDRDYLVSVCRDITERKRAEQELHLFRALAERANDAIEVIDPATGRFVHVNERACLDLGYSRDELLALTVRDVDPTSDPSAYGDNLARLRASDSIYVDTTHRRKDGTIFPVEIAVRLVTADREYLVAVVRDVSERRNAAASLRESETRLRNILDGMFAFVGLLTLDGLVLEINNAPLIALGVRRDDVLGLSAWDTPWFSGAPAAQEQVRQAVRRAGQGETLREDILVQVAGGAITMDANFGPLRDGSGRITHVVASAVDITGRKEAEAEASRLADFPRLSPNPVLELTDAAVVTFSNDAANAMAASLGFTGPGDMLPSDVAALVRTCLETARTQLRPDQPCRGRILFWRFHPIPSRGVVHAYAVDVTERHQMEAQLRQAQKMEAVGLLAGGVAHDFNNLLTVIQGHAGFLAESGMVPVAEAWVAAIDDAARRAAELTRQLLAFSRRQVLQSRNLDLQSLVTGTTNLLRRLLGEHIALEVKSASELPPIYGDQGMLEQVVMNLAINARDAMLSGGTLTIQTRLAHSPEQDLRRSLNAPPGDYVCLAVTDTGSGIAPEHLEHIFEPFFTTKGVASGTGLGLATVHSIVQQHSGWIDVRSDVGRGTTFSVYLPPAPRSANAHERVLSPDQAPGGSEVVLLVEDEDSVRDVTGKLLRRLGYEVLEASSGADALRVYAETDRRIDLLVTDLVMPGGVPGQDLAERLRRTQPGLKVLYSSGYSENFAGRNLVLGDGMRFLQKPFDGAGLGRAVRSCLDGL